MNPLLLEPIHAHLRDLQFLTGIRFIETRSPKKSQFNIYLTQDRYFRKHISRFVKNQKFADRLARKSNCFASFTTTSNHQITQANIVIPADHTFKKGLYVACVIEETTQVMGLPNDSDWVSPSIANDLDKQELLSPLDRMFLKTLYDPSLKPGMTIKEARPKIRHIIHRLLKQSGA